MASEEDPTVYGEEDADEDDDDDSEEEDITLPSSNPNLDDDVEEDDDDDDITSSNLAAAEPPKVTVAIACAPNGEPATPIKAGLVTVADSLPDPKRPRIEEVTIAAVAGEKKPMAALDDSRRLFQRLWTDEDEIELLQGFLDYTTQRGGGNSSHHHDTAAFYDQIKSKLQLDFNKNQLVEKLRRLKRKYRNVLSKIDAGKEYVFKSPHDQATFEISRKIWSSAGAGAGAGVVEEGGLDDDEANPNTNPNPFDHNNNGIDANSSEKKGSRSRKRSRVKVEEKHQFNQPPPQTATPTATSIPNLIEETVKSCLSPLFKELLQNAMNGPCGSRGYGGVAALNPTPLGFGSPVALNFTGSDNMMDEKWRKQQILELEVYSRRLDLVQDQIKSALEELRSVGR